MIIIDRIDKLDLNKFKDKEHVLLFRHEWEKTRNKLRNSRYDLSKIVIVPEAELIKTAEEIKE